MLAYLRQASYTADFTANVLEFVNLTATQFLTSKLLLSGNLYYRRLATNAGNDNVNDGYLDNNYAGPPFDCTMPPTTRAALTYCSPAQDANSRLTQRSSGFGVQLTDSRDVLG